MEEFYEAPRIELIFSAHNLEKSGLSSPPHTKLRFHYSEDNQTFTYVGETELVEKSYNPCYKIPLEHNYVFEVNQYVKVEVHNLVKKDCTEILSTLVFSIGNVMGCPGQTSMFALERKKNEVIGELLVQVHEFAVERDTAIIQCSGFNLPKKKGLTGTVNPYLTFYRNDGGEWRIVHQTEALIDIKGDAAWARFEIKLHKLCSGNKDTPLRVECLHKSKKEKKKQKIYGEFKTTVNRLLAGEKEYDLEKPKSKKKKFRGRIAFGIFKVEERYNLLDYLKGGLRLNLALGVDFTSSNGDPKFLDSLHSLCLPGQMNQYQMVLDNVCRILTHYIHDKRILPLGFGAKPMFPKFFFQRTHNCFPMTGDPEKPFVVGLNNLMQTYFHTLLNVQLYGPTFISYVIEEGMRKATYHKQKGDWEYTVMLIITDGDIHDLERTLPLIQQSSALPISFIIIGVGDEKFEEVSTIHAYNERISKIGGQKYRDCSQFVKFRDYASNPQKFARILLSRIPSQICEYMAMMGMKPTQQVKIDPLKLVAQKPGEEFVEYQPNKTFWDQFSQKKTVSSDEQQFQTKVQIQGEQHDPKILSTDFGMTQSLTYQPTLVQQNIVTTTALLQQQQQQTPPYMGYQQPQQNFGPQMNYFPPQQQFAPNQQNYVPQQQFMMQQGYNPQLQQSYNPQLQPGFMQQMPNISSTQYPNFPMQTQQNFNPSANFGYAPTQNTFQGYPQDYQKQQMMGTNLPQMQTNPQSNGQSSLYYTDYQKGLMEKSETQQFQPRWSQASDPNQNQPYQGYPQQQVDPLLSLHPSHTSEKQTEMNGGNSPVKQEALNTLPLGEGQTNGETDDNKLRSQVVYSTAAYEKDYVDDVKPEILATFVVDDQEIERTEETQPDKTAEKHEEDLPTLLGVIKVDSVYTITPHRVAKDL